MQFLADLLNVNVANGIEEVSALGAACLAGLQAQVFENLEDLAKLGHSKNVFSPGAGRVQANIAYQQYQKYLQMFLRI